MEERKAGEQAAGQMLIINFIQCLFCSKHINRDRPLQYSWTSLVAQRGKNLPAMRETWVRSLVWEDPLEEGIVTLSSILA